MSASLNNYGFVPLQQNENPQNSTYSFTPLQQTLPKKQGPYDFVEKTPEEFKALSLGQQIEYSENLERHLQQSQRKQEGAGIASGLTFGLSERIPGFETTGTPTETIGQVAGSIPAIEASWLKLGQPFVNLVSKSPIFAKQLSALARLVGWGAIGASESALQSIGKGDIPDADNMIEHGVQWASLDAILQTAGVAGRFTKALVNKARGTKQAPYKLLNQIASKVEKSGKTDPFDVSEFALNLLEPKQSKSSKVIALAQPKIPESAIPGQVSGKIGDSKTLLNDLSSKKVKPEIFDLKFEIPSGQVPEVNAESLIKDLEHSPSQDALNSFANKAPSQQALGSSIQESINESFKEAEQAYTTKYNEVKQIAQAIEHSPKSTIDLAEKVLNEINSLKTRPAGYQQVINTLNDSLSDLGVTIHEIENKLIATVNGKPVKLNNLRITQNIPLSKSIELGRRLNKIIDYDIVGSAIKNQLKPIVKSLKNDIHLALPESARNTYASAERDFAKTAERYSTDEMLALRGEASPEKIAGSLTSPSSYDRITQSVNPKLVPFIEREFLESLNSKSYEQASKLQREFASKLSNDARKIAEDIVQAKRPLHPSNAQERTRRLQKGVLNDLAQSFATDTRPTKALQLWKTPKGRRLINDSLHNSPNQRQVVQYLQKQSIYDALADVTTKGKLDFKEFNKLLKDPAFIDNIRGIAGKEGVQFMRNLESYTKRIERNFDLAASIAKREKPDTVKGKYLIEKAKEANLAKQAIVPKETQAAKPILPKPKMEAADAKQALKSKKERGDAILKRMVSKDYPGKVKLDKVLDYIGTPLQTIFGLLLPLKYGVVKGATALAGSRLLYRLLTSQKARRAFETLSRKPSSAQSFITALLALDEASHTLEPSAPARD